MTHTPMLPTGRNYVLEYRSKITGGLRFICTLGAPWDPKVKKVMTVDRRTEAIEWAENNNATWLYNDPPYPEDRVGGSA